MSYFKIICILFIILKILKILYVWVHRGYLPFIRMADKVIFGLVLSHPFLPYVHNMVLISKKLVI